MGGPRVHNEEKLAGQAPGGYKPEGMVWNAYAKGYRLELRATGTSKIVRVDLVRNNEYVYSADPGKESVELRYTDDHPKQGTNLYYFRLVQDDGEVAWCSPIWVNYGAK
ncbi:MAG: hypothetical protein HY000_13205 [Planctomycetes bacterium]|nr:hypothetical protein [Planctomycetota bacterium]